MMEQAPSIKEINQLRILNLLRSRPGISRAEITHQTGLGKATVSTLVSELIEAGVIYEDGVETRLESAGRRPIRLMLNESFRFAVGVEFTGSECIAALTDLNAVPLRFVRRPAPATSVEAVVDTIVGTVAEALTGYEPARVLGIGVGAPGPVDDTRQVVVQAENIGWVNVPLGPLLAAQTGQPVTVINRTNAGALGEYWHGAGKNHQNLVYVSVGLGIGAGIIIGGALYEGENGSAGEIGHVTIAPEGSLCRCGKLGCLETVASFDALAEQARQMMEHEGGESLLLDWVKGDVRTITGPLVIEAARQGDPLAIQVVQAAGRYLGAAIAHVVNLFNPSLVIIAGDLLELEEIFLDPVRELVSGWTFAIPLRCVEVVRSTLGHRAAAIGAAALVIDRFFELADPVSSLLLDQRPTAAVVLEGG